MDASELRESSSELNTNFCAERIFVPSFGTGVQAAKQILEAHIESCRLSFLDVRCEEIHISQFVASQKGTSKTVVPGFLEHLI